MPPTLGIKSILFYQQAATESKGASNWFKILYYIYNM